MNLMLSRAIALASTVFENRLDKGGQPYILHCLWVMYRIPSFDHELRTAAILHDVVEDSQYTYQDLLAMGYSKRVVDALRCLTHEQGDSYDDYIKGVATNHDAIRVKMADLRHNSDITRLKCDPEIGLTDTDHARIEKYNKSYYYLKGILDKLDDKKLNN